MTEDAAALLEDAEDRLAPLEREYFEREWDLHTQSSEERREAAEAAGIAYESALADPDLHARALAAERVADGDDALRRRAEVLRLQTAGKRRPPELIERIVRLETELGGLYAEHRAEVRGRRLSDNEIMDVLATATDEEVRRETWEASKAVGASVDERLRELVRLRNEAARRLGYRDHYAMTLEHDEIDEPWLYGLLDRLHAGLEECWRAEKQALDGDLRARLGLPADAPIMPWHLPDPFGQEAPSPPEDPLRDAEGSIDIEAAARRYFADLGHDVDAILRRSDLRPREGKDQHAFQITVDRRDDIRILCNIAPNLYWLETVLHELGHAVYDLALDPALPWLLRAPSHTFTTEAIAMLHGRRHRDREFLTRYAGVPADLSEHPTNRLVHRRRLHVFVPWVQVMARFERTLYADPDADLGVRWWDLVERYQGVPRPSGDRSHDWAAKVHLAVAPVYYHNYLLGELTASQLEWMLERETGNASPAAHPAEAGRLVSERFLRPGKGRRWDVLVEEATGAPLTPEHLVAELR